MSSMVEKSIEVRAPLRTVYNQWTQFEEFPHFMEGIKEVKQLDDKRLHWVAEVGGKTKEWDARITEQKPDLLISWESTSGAENTGHVTFTPVGDGTRVTARMTYDTEGWVEDIGNVLGFVDRRIMDDLERFKKFIEDRHSATGAWRGEIHQGKLQSQSGFGRSQTINPILADATTGIATSGSPSSVRSGRTGPDKSC